MKKQKNHISNTNKSTTQKVFLRFPILSRISFLSSHIFLDLLLVHSIDQWFEFDGKANVVPFVLPYIVLSNVGSVVESCVRSIFAIDVCFMDDQNNIRLLVHSIDQWFWIWWFWNIFSHFLSKHQQLHLSSITQQAYASLFDWTMIQWISGGCISSNNNICCNNSCLIICWIWGRIVCWICYLEIKIYYVWYEWKKETNNKHFNNCGHLDKKNKKKIFHFLLKLSSNTQEIKIYLLTRVIIDLPCQGLMLLIWQVLNIKSYRMLVNIMF